jgi:hypothetical protein
MKCPYAEKLDCPFVDTSGMDKTRDCDDCIKDSLDKAFIYEDSFPDNDVQQAKVLPETC